ncbi:MAG: patatin family protein [Ruminococcaceae bacterium]|nr:patatin family protein [Oscillospiraceae bacterium]
MKKGLVMEGGAMRGMFTAGVIDVLMEHNIEFDGGAGTSAGAAFGCNYKSHQIGRVIRYNKRFCRDKRFVSLSNLIKTGDLYGVDFSYREIPDSLDPFDVRTFSTSPMEFYVVATDMETGEAVYHLCSDGGKEDIEWMRASASMPLAARIVEINGQKLSDGGTADSIPLAFMEQAGYDRNLVILTQPEGYIKRPNRLLPLMKRVYKDYPLFVRALQTRHIHYNKTIAYIKEQEKKNAVFVIRPPEPLGLGAAEKNPNKLEAAYQIGRQTATELLPSLIDWMNQN